MAIYHCHVKPISRKSGMSAPARAAYCSGERVKDLRTGVVHARPKGGVEYCEIVLPEGALHPTLEWARDRERLWNAAEAAEKRKDARVAREYQLALPHELTGQQRIALVRGFARSLANGYGIAVDLSVHAPDKQGDQRNHHAHVLTTTRVLTAEGLGHKCPLELGDRDRARQGFAPAREEIRWWRHHWADLSNAHLKAQGHEVRIDARTLEAQGIAREPTRHKGWAIMDLQRRGKHSEVLERWQAEDRAHQQEKAAALAMEERQARELEEQMQQVARALESARAEEREARRLAAQKRAEERERKARQQAAEQQKQHDRQALVRLRAKQKQREQEKQQDKGNDYELEM